ncbi:hexosaminidase [Geosmithia morbida]|uniref:Beta-hexosaminidase n=1 Tax=Geosmithia morbida TaxID=1094350 RepID=A0A9P5D5S5_9HYPO|nr:hexosaminidase [Geosmithia morbida]KAF4124861.1 hexosaminidase [Geosmithia morbida]
MLSKSLLAVAALALSPAADASIWPIPKSLSTGNQTLFLDQSVAVTYNGQAVRIPHQDENDSRYFCDEDGRRYDRLEHLAETRFLDQRQQISYAAGYAPPAGSKFRSRDIVQGGIERTLSAIFRDGLTPWMLRERGSDFEPADGRDNSKLIGSLTITQTSDDDADTFKPKVGTVDESYSLNVTADGEASIRAASSTGVLRALETFSQLFYRGSDGQTFYTQEAPIAIVDEPKYPHRGVLLDVSRHWFEVADIKRTIDAAAMNKMNVLHLHVTDTQSWPLEIPSLPRLTEKGAYAKGLTYSPDDVAGLYEYAIHRGVQIVLELDMPGHVGVDEAYPGLTVAFDEHPYQWYCAQPPCGSFRLNNTDVEGFVDTLLADLLPRIAPYTSYFHTGGDEYKANNSLLDPALETNDVEVLQPLLQRFLSHVHGNVVENGLTPLVWEEMVLEWNATVPDGTLVQSWLGGSSVTELAEAGHKVIDSNSEYYYLDCGRGQWLDFPNGASFQTYYPFADWCSPSKSWRLIYSHEPTDGVPEELHGNIVGGEMALWTETIDTTSLDSIMWPRAAAAAEIWWSGRVDGQGQNRSQIDARPRLSEMRERMLRRGVRGTPITQLWCDMNGPEDCAQIE